LLSAFGIGTAAITRMATRQVLAPLHAVGPQLEALFAEAEQRACAEVAAEGIARDRVAVRRRLCYLRFAGQEHAVEIEWQPGMDVAAAFEQAYRRLFGHYPAQGVIEVESIKVVAAAEAEVPEPAGEASAGQAPAAPLRHVQAHGREVPVYYWPALGRGQHIEGPAIVLHDTATAWLDEGWQLEVAPGQNLVLRHTGKSVRLSANAARSEVVALELFSNRFTAIAEEMGAQLQRTAFSTNVKERLDFSCALLDPEARLLVNAPHIPVHLGSLGVCARLVLEALPLQPGDVVITNHPKYGGSHLPDITLLAGVWHEGRLLGYVVNRAHHADVGGKRPGSMPPDARTLAEEGVVIPPTYLARGGEVRWHELERLLSGGPWPVRMLHENLADINAALAALRTGQERLVALARSEGIERTLHYMQALRQATAAAFAESWRRWDGRTFEAEEQLDDGTPIRVRIEVRLPQIVFDFTGTGPVHAGNLNANIAILHSVVIYVLRLACGHAVPLNEGLMEHVRIVLPEGTLLHPNFVDDGARCPAVVGGNTEVSQRLTDTLLKALDLAACSQGTMNNLLFGNDRFGYYETIGGGAGAGPGFHGRSGVHQHMTNTRLTDVEELERRYPVRVHRFALR
ncbi:MAG: 5-oxoprolinase, partial [Bacteroidetes bacterium]